MFAMAERLTRIKTSPTAELTARVSVLREHGHDIIGLVAGEPDFDTPPNIRAAAAAAAERGATRYTAIPGTVELRQAIREKFDRENGLHYEIDQVIVGGGGKQVIFNALMASLSPGDEVIIPAPYWVSYPEIVQLADATPVIVPCSEETGFRLSPADLEAAITSRTRWLILNAPSNPSGAAYTADELRAVADVLLRHPHVWVITDDIYEHFVYDGFKTLTIAAVEPRLFGRTLTVNGVSKTYCMTGWRIGYAGGPTELIRAMAAIQSHSTTNACSVSQAAAVEALSGPQDCIGQFVGAYHRRRDLVVNALNAIPGLTCHRPVGSFYVFPSCAGLIGSVRPDGRQITSDYDFVIYLMEQGGVGTVHGAAFGLSPFFRISYAAPENVLEVACARISKACGALRRSATQDRREEVVAAQ